MLTDEEEPDTLSVLCDELRHEECVASRQNKIALSDETMQSQRHSTSFKNRCKNKMNSCWRWLTTWILPCLADDNRDRQSASENPSAETRPTRLCMIVADDEINDDATQQANEITMHHVSQTEIDKPQNPNACTKRFGRSAAIVSMSDVLAVYRATQTNRFIAVDPPSWVSETQHPDGCKICFKDTHVALPCCGAHMCGRCVNVWWLYSTGTTCPLCEKPAWPRKVQKTCCDASEQQ